MQRFAVGLAASLLSLAVMLPSGADAMTAGTAPGVKNALAETSSVENVVRVCRHRFFTSERRCWTDRSRPPTVCHRIRGTNRLDCY
jgi:hypothetical protein